MLEINPYLYRVVSSSYGTLFAIPIDILQAHMITEKTIKLNVNDLAVIILISNLLAIQNNILSYLNYNSKISLKMSFITYVIPPLFFSMQSKKYYYRLGIKLQYRNLIFWNIIKKILFYNTIYTFYKNNIYYSFIIAPQLCNFISYSLKIYSLKNIKYKNIKYKNIFLGGSIDFLKSLLGDFISIYLINNYKFN